MKKKLEKLSDVLLALESGKEVLFKDDGGIVKMRNLDGSNVFVVKYKSLDKLYINQMITLDCKDEYFVEE